MNIYNWNIQNFIISKTSIILNLPYEKNLSYFKHYFFLLQSNITQTHLGCHHFKSYTLHQMLATYDEVFH